MRSFWHALEVAQAPIYDAIFGQLTQGERVVGVHGAPQSGKTTMASGAARAYEAVERDVSLITVDFAAAYGLSPVIWRIVRDLARSIAGPVAFSHMTSLEQGAWPAGTRTARLDIQRELGELSAIALSDAPPPEAEAVSLRDVLAAVEDRAARQRILFLVDHPEALSLTPRHPVDVEAVLWQIRGIAQRTERIQTLIAVRTADVDKVTGPKSAFLGDGWWLKIGAPGRQQWHEIASTALDEVDSEGLSEFVNSAYELVDGHTASMHRLFMARSRDRRPARELLDDVADDVVPLAARTLENARNIHRYGAAILLAFARYQRPQDAEVGALAPREINRAIPKLAQAGLIEKSARSWRLCDPMVAYVLRGRMVHYVRGTREGATETDNWPEPRTGS